MDPITLAALIAGGFGLFSTGASAIGSAVSNNRANETNMDIAQMNNEFSERQLEKQMAYSDKQWERQVDYSNEMWDKSILNQWSIANYNSPANQVQRFRDAGINPYLAMSGNNSGVVTSSASTSSPGSTGSPSLPSPSQVQVRPNQFDFSGIGSSVLSAIEMYNQLKNDKLGRERVSIENQMLLTEKKYQEERILKSLYKLSEEGRGQALKNEAQEYENMFGFQNAQLQYEQNAQALLNAQATYQSLVIANLRNSVELSYLPQQMQLGLQEQGARIALMEAQGRLTEKQIATEVEKALEIEARKNGIKFDNETKQACKNEIIQGIKDVNAKYGVELERIDNNAGPEGMHGVPNFIYGLGKNILRAGQAGYNWVKSW